MRCVLDVEISYADLVLWQPGLFGPVPLGMVQADAIAVKDVEIVHRHCQQNHSNTCICKWSKTLPSVMASKVPVHQWLMMRNISAANLICHQSLNRKKAVTAADNHIAATTATNSHPFSDPLECFVTGGLITENLLHKSHRYAVVGRFDPSPEGSGVTRVWKEGAHRKSGGWSSSRVQCQSSGNGSGGTQSPRCWSTIDKWTWNLTFHSSN